MQRSQSIPCISTAPADPQREAQLPVTGAPAVPQLPTPDALAAVAQLFQSPHGQEVNNALVQVLYLLAVMAGKGKLMIKVNENEWPLLSSSCIGCSRTSNKRIRHWQPH